MKVEEGRTLDVVGILPGLTHRISYRNLPLVLCKGSASITGNDRMLYDPKLERAPHTLTRASASKVELSPAVF